MSRWLVGSSIMSTSQLPINTRARSTRRRCPPDRLPTGASWSRSPTSSSKMPRMRASPAHSYSGRSPTMAWMTVSASSRWSRCPSMPTVTDPVLTTRPASGSSSPESTASKEDLPSPLRPTMPMRSPAFTPRLSASKIRAVGNSSSMFSHPRRNAMTHPHVRIAIGCYCRRLSRRRARACSSVPIEAP